jgi:hypothetical protein
MIHDLITAFLVAFAAVTASEDADPDLGGLLSARRDEWPMTDIPPPPNLSILLILEFAVAGAVLAAVTYFVATLQHHQPAAPAVNREADEDWG